MRLVMTTVVLALVAFPNTVLGQDQSLQDVRSRLREGEWVRIVDISRTPASGRLVSLDSGAFLLRKRGKSVTVPDNRVYLIQVHRREGDGVLIGAAIGAAAGLTLARVECRDASERGDCIRAASIVFGGSMAAAGALVDHLVKRYTTVFDRTSAGTTLRLAPVWDARRKGVVMVVSF